MSQGNNQQSRVARIAVKSKLPNGKSAKTTQRKDAKPYAKPASKTAKAINHSASVPDNEHNPDAHVNADEGVTCFYGFIISESAAHKSLDNLYEEKSQGECAIYEESNGKWLFLDHVSMDDLPEQLGVFLSGSPIKIVPDEPKTWRLDGETTLTSIREAIDVEIEDASLNCQVTCLPYDDDSYLIGVIGIPTAEDEADVFNAYAVMNDLIKSTDVKIEENSELCCQTTSIQDYSGLTFVIEEIFKEDSEDCKWFKINY